MPNETDLDASLMLRVKTGDLAAFEALVEKYKTPVVNLLARTLGDPAEAEDVAQNVFVQVFKSAGRYEATARFSTWLFTIARNLALNEIRRRSRHPAISLDESASEAAGLPGRQYEDKKNAAPSMGLLQEELRRKVEEALADLPENQRTALLLFREDVSYEEIAQVLRCSLSATKSLIHRARETLKARLKPYLKSGVWPGKRP